MSNITNTQFFSLTLISLSIVHFENIVFDNVTNNGQPIFYFLFNFDTVTIKNLTVSNLSGTSTGLSDIIDISNFPQAVTIVEQLHVFDVILDGKAAIKSISELNQIQQFCVNF